MKLSIFKLAILLHPTDEEAKKGIKTTFIQEPTYVLATSQQVAERQALVSLDPKYKDKLEQIVVACGPF